MVPSPRSRTAVFVAAGRTAGLGVGNLQFKRPADRRLDTLSTDAPRALSIIVHGPPHLFHGPMTVTTAKEDSPLPQRLDAQRTQDLLRAVQELSDAPGRGIDTAALAAARQPLAPQDDQYPEACLHLQSLFPRRTAAHTQELGEAPLGAYPRLLAGYAVASGGDFAPQGIEADSDDGWDTLTLEFMLGGKAQRFKVSGVADSDWFTADFVKALNRFAKRAGLPGRWVDFHGNDACTSIYVPEAAHTRFKALKRKYSAATGDETVMTPELIAFAESHSIASPPSLLVTLDKEQLAARKAEWPGYEARLRIRHSKSEVKMLERYYLSGKEPKWDMYWESDPIPLLYRLWLYPDQSDAAWCAVTERVLAYPQGTGRSLLDSDSLWDYAYSSSWDGRDWPAGAFKGAEKRLLHFLQGRLPCSAHFLYNGKPLRFRMTRFNPRFYRELLLWLNDTPPYNPFMLIRFQAGDWLSGINGEQVPKLLKEYREHGTWLQDATTEFFTAVAAYPAPSPGEPGDERQAFCQEVSEHLDGRALPVPFDAWWAQAKQNAAVR